MLDLFLICHKVRSEPAFDVACQMPCPECREYEYVEGMAVDEVCVGCNECDGLGYWWIVPTSGHRAYPYFWVALNKLKMYFHDQDGQCVDRFDLMIEAMSPSLPDHYPTRSTPATSLIDSLGLRKPKAQAPTPPVHRRF